MLLLRVMGGCRREKWTVSEFKKTTFFYYEKSCDISRRLGGITYLGVNPGLNLWVHLPTAPSGAIHQLLNIILKLRILVLLPVSTLPYVVKVTNYS
jgi:hypothetical protein